MQPTDLVSMGEIAKLRSVHRSMVTIWIKRDLGFPEPWGQWGTFRLWRKVDVEAWHANRQAVMSMRKRIAANKRRPRKRT